MGRQRTIQRGWRQLGRTGALALGCLALAHCSGPPTGSQTKYTPRVVEEGEPVPKGGGSYRAGKSDAETGRTSTENASSNYRAEGIASWYGPDFHGRPTANGEVYDMHGISAAHRTMPLPSYARVTNLENGRSIIVRVNNRGPYKGERVIDLSIGTAKALKFYSNGLAQVRVEYIGRAPLEGSDNQMLLATLRDGAPAPAPSKVMVAAAKPFVGGPLVAAERPRALGRNRSVSEPLVTSSVPPTREAGAAADAPATGFAPLGGSTHGLMSGRGLY